MLGIHDFGLFIVSGLLLNVTPGPDTAYIVGRSLATGLRGGVLAALGISAGCLVHVVGGAIGLLALLASSAEAFALVKWAGAAYLAWLGITMLVSRPRRQPPGAEMAAPGAATSGAATSGAVFWQGALTNVLNPKVALFFLAFLPQFVAADSPHKPFAFLLLGAIFVINGTLWCLGVAVAASRMAGRVRRSTGLLPWINRAIGGMFVYLGIRIAMLEAR